jgi:NitT/TauT family transport system permease protein
MVKTIHNYTYSVLGIVIFITIWQFFSILLNNPAVPSIDKIFVTFFNIVSSQELNKHLTSSVVLVFYGIIIATIGGSIMGVVSYWSNSIYRMFNIIFDSFRNVSAITLFPLLIVLMGLSNAPRIFIIIWTAFPAIFLSQLKGLRSVSREVIEASENVGASTLQKMIYIIYPLALPDLMTGIKVGISGGFISLVVSEMLGATSGLGFMILWETNSFKYPNVYAYIVIVALVGYAFNVIFDMLIKRLREEV